MLQARFILFHKHRTSARLRFLLFPHGVMAFEPLPAGAVEQEQTQTEHALLAFPPAWIRLLAQQLGIPAQQLEPEPEFRVQVVCGNEQFPILLVGFAGIDPPFALAQSHQGRFVHITELSHLPALELALLRKAYETVIG